MMSKTWNAEIPQATERWILLPNTGEADVSETWVEEALTRLRGSWGDAWSDEIDAPARDLLTHHLADDLHPATLAALLHWPVPAAAVSRVRIVLGSGPVKADEWQQMGFDVDEYSEAALGPGLRCLASQTAEVDGENVELVTCIFVFAADEVSVMVVVEAGGPEIFGLTFVEMPQFLADLEVFGPDGTPFSALPVPGVTSDPFDVWEDSSFV